MNLSEEFIKNLTELLEFWGYELRWINSEWVVVREEQEKIPRHEMRLSLIFEVMVFHNRSFKDVLEDIESMYE